MALNRAVSKKGLTMGEKARRSAAQHRRTGTGPELRLRAIGGDARPSYREEV